MRRLEEMTESGPNMTTPIARDGALVAALRRGDPTAADDLVATYGDRACRLATRITRSAQDAEEAVPRGSRTARSPKPSASPSSTSRCVCIGRGCS